MFRWLPKTFARFHFETPCLNQIQPALVLDLLLGLVNHVHDPGADGFDEDLRAFLFQELEHVEVPVALGGLGPEFAGDLYQGLYAGAVHRDGVKAVAHLVERRGVVVAIELVQEFAKVFRRACEPCLAQQ